MEIIICDDNLSERSLMIDYILKWASEKYLEIQINTCKDWMELAAALEGREWDMVIVSLDGVRGLDTAASQAQGWFIAQQELGISHQPSGYG